MERTAVCCLSVPQPRDLVRVAQTSRSFIPDVMRFLDNVLQSFIDTAPDSMARARYSAMRERSVGLGVMGFHSFLQGLGVPFESAVAKAWNKKMFKHIRTQADDASRLLAEERGPCPDAAEYGFMERFSNKMAIARRQHLHHLRRRLARHRADRGQRVQPQDAQRLLHRAQPVPEGGAAEARAGRRRHLDHHHRQQGERAAPRLPVG
jgi:ribonucleotide reductase alpha subunit